MQRYRLIEDDTDVLFASFGSTPALPVFWPECRLDGIIGSFRRDLYGRNVLELEPAFIRFIVVCMLLTPNPLTHTM